MLCCLLVLIARNLWKKFRQKINWNQTLSNYYMRFLYRWISTFMKFSIMKSFAIRVVSDAAANFAILLNSSGWKQSVLNWFALGFHYPCSISGWLHPTYVVSINIYEFSNTRKRKKQSQPKKKRMHLGLKYEERAVTKQLFNGILIISWW